MPCGSSCPRKPLRSWSSTEPLEPCELSSMAMDLRIPWFLVKPPTSTIWENFGFRLLVWYAVCQLRLDSTCFSFRFCGCFGEQKWRLNLTVQNNKLKDAFSVWTKLLRFILRWEKILIVRPWHDAMATASRLLWKWEMPAFATWEKGTSSKCTLKPSRNDWSCLEFRSNNIPKKAINSPSVTKQKILAWCKKYRDERL